MDGDLERFERKVEEIGSIIKGLCSKNEKDVQRASMKADLLLAVKKDFDENEVKVKADRTVINKICTSDQSTMDKDVFMATVEKDAKRRAEDRRRRQEIANSLKKSGNDAFGREDFTKAIDLYTKAINEVKDSTTLYANRAVTYLRLGLYKKMLDDCVWALKVDENCLRGWLLKGRAHFELGNVEEADNCIQEAIKRHPDLKSCIDIYVAEWRWREEGEIPRKHVQNNPEMEETKKLTANK